MDLLLIILKIQALTCAEDTMGVYSRPPHQTRFIDRVAVISAIGSPLMSTKSAWYPGSITPRSFSPKFFAGNEVAARKASTV